MKNTGIVRRLDALGRIVIPREYRKLLKIELGDPLEISANDQGEIVFKKVDMTAQLISAAGPAVDLMANTLWKTAVVSDFSKWLVGSGTNKNNLVGRDLPSGQAKYLKERRSYNTTTSNDIEGLKIEESGFNYVACAPIMTDSDCFGGLYLFSNDAIADSEFKMVKIAAGIIGNNLQKF